MADKIIENELHRGKVIVRTSIIGVITNVLLAAFKATVGILTKSIAIILDAVNNLSDAASSVVTIVGAKLAGKEPDKKHPFGHGRAEYLSAMVISVLVLYAGITSLVESVKKIMDPVTPEYTTASLIIVSVAVVVKIVLGTYVKKTGEKVNSDSLINSGQDARLDAVISLSTLIAAIVFLFFGLSLEAYLGAIISVVLIKAGIDMIRETISHILGEAGDEKLHASIKKTVRSFPEVIGAYDLVLNDYGPDVYMASIHVEVAEELTAPQVDQLSREIAEKVYKEHGVVMTAVGIYSLNTKDPEIIDIRKRVGKIVMGHEHVLQFHGFYYNKETKNMRFDMVIEFGNHDRMEIYKHIVEELKEEFPGCNLAVTMDSDFGAVKD